MAITQEPHIRLEVEESEDATGAKTIRVRCRGRLVYQNAPEIKNRVRPLVARGGRVVIDLAEVNYLDSAGLGALVGLKVSAVNQGDCRLELENLSPWIRDMLRMTHLTEFFSSHGKAS
jgi:anti-anti-sigma factor